MLPVEQESVEEYSYRYGGGYGDGSGDGSGDGDGFGNRFEDGDGRTQLKEYRCYL